MTPARTAAKRGFTLLELLIVLAIFGLLASIALPTYQQAVRAAARSEGQSLLWQIAANQERYYVDHYSYSTDADPLSKPAQATLTSSTGLYQASVAACTGGSIRYCFVATAVPSGQQAVDSCSTLTLSHTGLRGATGDSVQNCWR
jgi:type IV pilus assembly protein PilE